MNNTHWAILIEQICKIRIFNKVIEIEMRNTLNIETNRKDAQNIELDMRNKDYKNDLSLYTLWNYWYE